jgi:hypothetical protein
LYQRAQFPGLLRFLDSGGFQGFVTLLTIYALFGDDIRVMGFDKDADIGFDALNIICLVKIHSEIDNLFFRSHTQCHSQAWVRLLILLLVRLNLNYLTITGHPALYNCNRA